MRAFPALPRGFFPECAYWSQHAGLAETVEAAAQRIGGRPAHDDMVEQVDIDGLGGVAELPGLCEVPNYGK